jgi:hypothetical protein
VTRIVRPRTPTIRPRGGAMDNEPIVIVRIADIADIAMRCSASSTDDCLRERINSFLWKYPLFLGLGLVV